MRHSSPPTCWLSRCAALLRRSRVVLALAAAGVAGCGDALVGPEVLQQNAGGQLWTAVNLPAGVPDAQTWLPYLRPVSAVAQGRLRLVQQLRGEAARWRRAGDMLAARDAEEEAAELAALSLTAAPAPAVLEGARGALAAWCAQVAASPVLSVAPEVQRSQRAVMAELTAADSLLVRGDTTAAVVRLAAGARRVRDHTPATVAATAVARAEARLRASGLAENPRVRHLIGSTRAALATGEYSRAFWRAVYGLQLAELARDTGGRSGGDSP